MKIDNKYLVLTTYISLLLLTIVTYLLDRYIPIENSSRILIILASSIKFLLVYFVFMGVVHAHKFWKYMGIFLVLVQMTAVIFLT